MGVWVVWVVLWWYGEVKRSDLLGYSRSQKNFFKPAKWGSYRTAMTLTVTADIAMVRVDPIVW